MPKKKPSTPEDALESPAATEKRLGIAVATRKAARRYADAGAVAHSMAWRVIVSVYTAGALWERRRRKRMGY